MDTDKFLPLGSVVKITDNEEEIMIIGYLGFYEEEKGVQAYDYIGCKVLTGYTDNDIVLFDKELIDNVIFMGYKTEESIANLKRLDKICEKIRNMTDEELDKQIDKGITRTFTSSIPSSRYSSLASKIMRKEGIKHD